MASCCLFTGQTAGSAGQAVGGSPGYPTVSPCMGPQGPGAPCRLAPGPPLCGVGEDEHHHPSGGAGHHRPANGGLRGQKGGSSCRLVSPWSTFLVWEWHPARIEQEKKKTKKGRRSRNQSLQASARTGGEGVRVWRES